MKARKMLSQEIEVFYLIPSLRKEFAKIFINKYGMKQNKVAEILGITESAVSQYIKLKRAGEIKFDGKSLKKIEGSADRIVKNPSNMMKELYNLCVMFRENKVVCDIHRKNDPSIGRDCEDCF